MTAADPRGSSGAGDPGPTMPGMAEPLERMKEGARAIRGMHADIGQRGRASGVITADDMKALRERIRDERKWLPTAMDAFTDHRPHAELYGLLLLDAERQLTVLLTTPGKGIVDDPERQGPAMSRIAAAMLGLADLEKRLS